MERSQLYAALEAFRTAWPEYDEDWRNSRITDLERAMIDTPAKLKSAIDNAGVNQRLQATAHRLLFQLKQYFDCHRRQQTRQERP